MNSVVCPHCGKKVELSDAFRHEMEDALRKELNSTIKEELQKAASIEVEDLKKENEEQKKRLNDMRQQELTLREEKRKVEEREKDLNLEVARKLDEERKKVSEEVMKQATEEHRHKEMEKEKVITQLREALEDAQRKASQGSQQLQGEVLELDLEDNLRQAFPSDNIEPVGKGVRGADIKQIVRSPLGHICGTVLWESKRTKAWSNEWLTKLKEDLRNEKADIPVIVTSTLPKEVPTGLGLFEGVWVVKYELALSLASLLRKGILDVARQKVVSAQKADKASQLYDYVMGHEFRQQIEALTEVFTEMNEQITRERVAFEKIWKSREGQMKRMITSTVNMYGSIHGLVGSQMPQIKGLDLMELEDGQN